MSTVRVSQLPASNRTPSAAIPYRTGPSRLVAIRVAFWALGTALAAFQAWIFRYQISADSISYLDMSDGMMRGFSAHRLINGVWSPLYPVVLGAWRRVLGVGPSDEIASGHYLNILIFLFAFVCFEFLIRSWSKWSSRSELVNEKPGAMVRIPHWAILVLAYSLFLWASISEISLEKLRPDMLMSAFLYLAVAIVLRMRHQRLSWTHHLALGAILGIAFLAKAAMLPVGFLIVGAAFAVEEWRPRALKMTVAAFAVMLLIGSLYFIPLSRDRGRFTMGESGSYNYLVHVDHVGPGWYVRNIGSARGSFLRSPEKIFASPPSYAFPSPLAVTHPLRYDPSDWTAGVHAHFDLRGQLRSIEVSKFNLRKILSPLAGFPVLIVILAFLSRKKSKFVAALLRNWPLWGVGLAGCAMYVLVHVEPRYVGAFLAVLCFGIVAGFRIPAENKLALSILIAAVAIATVSLTLGRELPADYAEIGRHANIQAEAAAALKNQGVQPGDRVGLISPMIQDLALARIARVEIVTEVDRQHVSEFWHSAEPTQEELLHTMVAHGATAVIAVPPAPGPANAAHWSRLGSSQYWLWQPENRGLAEQTQSR